MSSSNSIMSEKKSLANIQRSKSFSEEQHKSMMSEEGEIQRSKSLPEVERVVDIISVIVTVFRVPKALSETKPEAYAPRKLGLGPFHHFRRDLYPMQRKKLDDVNEFMHADEEKGLRNIRSVRFRLAKLQKVIRGSYAERLNLKDSVLEKVIATDGIYLLNWLHHHDREDTDAETMKVIRGDILMLENQIPGDLILDIWKILSGEERVLSTNIRAFCEQESPLQLAEKPDDVLPFLKNGHLLNVLYNLILQREIKTYGGLTREITSGEFKRKMKIRKEIRINFGEVAETSGGGPTHKKKPDDSAAPGPDPDQVEFVGLADAVSGVNLDVGAIIHKVLSILQKFPWGQFLNKLRYIDPDREENTAPVEEIQIPSASLLSRNAGIRFESCTEKGIGNIRFDKKKRTLYLPAITLTSNSEVILRNLLAYEAAITRPEFAEYVDLMCGIVDTPNDVIILRKAEIIAGNLKPVKIASIFNGIWRSTGDEEEKNISNIGEAIKGVNEFYGSRFNVRMWRFIHRHIFVSWKLLAVVSSAVALSLLALRSFCEIYDCNKHWFGGTNYDLSRSFDWVGSFSLM